MSAPLAFWMPVLPRRALASNGGAAGSHRNPWAVADAKEVMKLQVETALIPAFVPLPAFTRVRLYTTAHIAYRRPRLEDCPRCLDDALRGEAWKNANGKMGCRCYRLTDPTNLGGDVTKAIPDTLRNLGVIKDDTYRYVDAAIYRIQPVEEVKDEGLAVVVEPIEETP